MIAARSALGGWTIVPDALTDHRRASPGSSSPTGPSRCCSSPTSSPIDQALNGSWLIAIVATESLAITWVLVTNIQPGQRATLQLLAYAFWTFGVLLYLIFITLIMYRFFFLRDAAERPEAALLDQYGRDGHHHRRGRAHAGCRRSRRRCS